MILLNIDQDSTEWHELRRTKIGASDAPIILKDSPYVTPSQLMEQKLVGKKSFSSPAMRRGKELEPVVRSWFSDRYQKVDPVVVQSEDRDWMIASLDGMSADGKTIIEIKCPNEDTYRKVKKGDIPKHYQWQIQHQLAVTGLSKCVLIVSDGVDPIDIDIPRDDYMIRTLLDAEEEFYHKMVNWEYPEDEKTKPTERNDPEAVEIIEAALKAKQWLETAKEQYDIIRDGAIYLANEISFRCKGVVVRKMLVQGTVDYKRMMKDFCIDPEKYRTPGKIQWRLEFPKEQEA